MNAMQFSLASLLLASTSAGIAAGHWRLIYDTAAAHPILRAGGTDAYAEITPDIMFRMKRPG